MITSSWITFRTWHRFSSWTMTVFTSFATLLTHAVTNLTMFMLSRGHKDADSQENQNHWKEWLHVFFLFNWFGFDQKLKTIKLNRSMKFVSDQNCFNFYTFQYDINMCKQLINFRLIRLFWYHLVDIHCTIINHDCLRVRLTVNFFTSFPDFDTFVPITYTPISPSF